MDLFLLIHCSSSSVTSKSFGQLVSLDPLLWLAMRWGTDMEAVPWEAPHRKVTMFMMAITKYCLLAAVQNPSPWPSSHGHLWSSFCVVTAGFVLPSSILVVEERFFLSQCQHRTGDLFLAQHFGVCFQLIEFKRLRGWLRVRRRASRDSLPLVPCVRQSFRPRCFTGMFSKIEKRLFFIYSKLRQCTSPQTYLWIHWGKCVTGAVRSRVWVYVAPMTLLDNYFNIQNGGAEARRRL